MLYQSSSSYPTQTTKQKKNEKPIGIEIAPKAVTTRNNASPIKRNANWQKMLAR